MYRVDPMPVTRARLGFGPFARQFCSSARPGAWYRLKVGLSHFSLRPKPALRFDNFPRREGHVLTLGAILGINVSIFIGWQLPELEETWSNIFLWSNMGLREGRFWTILTPSFSHSDLAHLTVQSSSANSLTLLAVFHSFQRAVNSHLG